MRAIVLGSGLGDFTNYFENIKSESFGSLLNFQFEILDGHNRAYVWCRYEGEEFLIISGKFHFYEGHSYAEIISPIKYAIEEFGVDEVVVTSASGGLSAKSKTGDWTHINGIVSFPETNLDVKLNFRKSNKIKKHRAFQSLSNVTYAYHQGPSLGSEAEYKMLHFLGADLVGMSMYPEYCYLKSLDVKSYFLSIPVCNYYPFDNTAEPSFEEVLEYSSASVPVLVDIFKKLF